MKHKLKTAGLTLVALLAMVALQASAASAESFHTEGTESVLKGSQVGEDIWTFNAGTVSCQEATYSGSQSVSTSETFKVVPKYTECKAFGFVNTTVDVNGCTFNFNANNATTFIDCFPNTPMVITAFNCWVTVGQQTIPGSGITYTNTGSGTNRDVDLKFNLGSMSYTQHSKSFPGCTNGVFGNGKYTGSATVQATTLGGVLRAFFKF